MKVEFSLFASTYGKHAVLEFSVHICEDTATSYPRVYKLHIGPDVLVSFVFREMFTCKITPHETIEYV